MQDGYFQADCFIKGRMIDANGTIVTGAFKDDKITGPGELKAKSMTYSGDFKAGAIAKGILTWTSHDNRQLKWNGIADDS